MDLGKKISEKVMTIGKNLILSSALSYLGLACLVLVLINPQLPMALAEGTKPTTSSNYQLPERDKIIAVIENEPLTLRDLRRFIREAGGIENLAETSPEYDRYYQEFLTNQLVAREAKVLGISVSEDDVKAYVEEVKKQNQISDQQLSQLLISKNMNLTGYRNQIQQEILRTRLIQQHARSTISISDQDVKRHLGVASSDKQSVRHLYQIFVPFAEDGGSNNFSLAESVAGGDGESHREAKRHIAEELKDKIAVGEDLKKVGGGYFSDLGPVSADDLMSDLQEPVSDLSENEVTDLIETERGFYIFAPVTIEESAGDLTDEVRETARRQLFEGKLKSEMENYITKELPKKFNLEKRQ